MKPKSRRTLWISLALVGLIAGGAAYALRPQEKPVTVTLAKSELGDITSVVTATGKVQPEVEVRISSEVPGEIVELPIRDGQQVKRGDLLVRVQPDTLEAQVKQQEAALSATRAQAAQEKAQLLQAGIDLKRTEELSRRGFASQDQVDQARTQVEVRTATHQAALHSIERQDMSLKEARDQLAKTSVFAPIDGTITILNSELGDRVVGTGQFAGTEIARVANLENMEVRVEVSEADIVGIAVGNPATVEIDAIPDEKFEGKVTEIANSAIVAKEGSQEQNTTFLVKVKLLQPNERMRPGMTATADIRTKTVQGIVKVPLQSVTVRTQEVVDKALGKGKETEGAQAESKDATPKGKQGEVIAAESGQSKGKSGRKEKLPRVVFVVEDGEARLVPVETGIADDRFIEIRSGLTAGQTVVSGSYAAIARELKHESRVKEEEPAKDGDKGRKS